MPGVQMSKAEFIALVAMMFATIAFSIDAMLPALPEIGAALSPQDANRAQLVITSFVLGMGVGTLFTGPLSDTFGRRPVILGGAALYIAAALVAAQAQSLEVLLAARVVMGLGAAGPRVVALAIIRDLYAGRGMAQLMSFVMIVFSLVPAIAPTLGAGIIALSSWRVIFLAFVVFAIAFSIWMMLRLPETLDPAQRRPFRFSAIRAATAEMFAHPVVRLSILVQSLSFGMLFSMLSTTQPIFDVTFGRNDSFPYWFGAIAVVAASASYVNARLVVRLGMRVLVTWMLAAQLGISALMVLAWVGGVSGSAAFALFVFWQTSVFFQAGMTIGNLNAIAMEPMGHIAGLAASIIGSVATVAAVVLAAPVGLMFDGTPLPLALALTVEAGLGLWLMLRMRGLEQTAAA